MTCLFTFHVFLHNQLRDVHREVPVGNLLREDIIVWPWNNSGLYSVRSGYNKRVVFVSSIGRNNR